ncbi:MAG: hypothetical protein J6Q11_01180 [Fibrobacteraceae bacterium]|nr:hypothetical protein [Fibrobacteraceae bacterium]
MEEKRYTILQDEDFTLKKIPEYVLEENELGYFLRLEELARTKLFTKQELVDFVSEVETIAEACDIKLTEKYFLPYNKEFFGLFANRAQKASYESGGEIRCALKNFNKLQDFLADKAAELG